MGPSGELATVSLRHPAALFAVLVAIASGLGPAGARATSGSPLSGYDWPTYGHDYNRTFHGQTTLTQTSVRTLLPKWHFHTGDAVTANPIVVRGSVYVGSWDGCFYAIDAKSGASRWSFGIDLDQPGISPQPSPGACPRSVSRQPTDITTDGGYITSTAAFVPANRKRPDLVVFGGGFTLYALVANNFVTANHAFHAGDLFWKHKYPGTGVGGALKPKDDSRIFSSPAVVGDHVLFSEDADGNNGFRGYMVSADLNNGEPQWVRELDVDTAGKILNNGCGNVWASPTVIARLGIEVAAASDCDFNNTAPYHERMLAVNISDGKIRWIFDPGRVDPSCDWDFGATANLGTKPDGTPTFLGVGGKDGTYYRVNPYTGKLIWKKNVLFGGFSGGFLGSTAFDGNRVYGATALGDFGRFEGFGSLGCQPGNPKDQLIQDPSIHAFDATTGKVEWQGYLSQSFGPTTVAGGMTFVGTGITREIQIRDAATGGLIWILPLIASSDSGVVVTKNSIVFGTGSSEQGVPDGVWAYTPLGAAVE